ncbi:hypothetical protein QCA50_004538 [Cerrena zonata]|uniref:Uncharacterized protein n=1 Tax=Cerrena zonata TaxID=2478898 RepID=A0AAW0GJS4_9APHY
MVKSISGPARRRTSLWDDFDFWRRIYGFSSASANIRPIKPRFDYSQWENFWPPSSIMDHIPSLNGPVIGKSESPLSE